MERSNALRFFAHYSKTTLLILDEATSADTGNRMLSFTCFRNKQNGINIILITHDRSFLPCAILFWTSGNHEGLHSHPRFNALRRSKALCEAAFVKERMIEEIIVVDDHSSDDSKCFHRLHMTTLLSLDVGNQPIKRRLQRAKSRVSFESGRIYQWLDADDILGPGKLRHQLQLISDSQNCIVACPFRCFAGSPETGRSMTPGYGIAYESGLLGGLQRYDDWITLLAYARFVTSAGSWDESLNINQDDEYFARVVASAKRVLFDDQVEVYYRREGGGVSKFCAEKADSLFRSIESMANTALQIEDSNRMRQMISNRWQHFIYTAYPHAPELRRQAEALLKELPTPTLPNPQTVSEQASSSAGSSVKTLMHIRQWRGHV